MIYKLKENTYKKYNNYVFKDQIFLNNNNKLVYCFVAIKNNNIECLAQNLNGFQNDYKNKLINDYLNFKESI